MEEQEDYDYQVNLRIEDIRLLYHCVQKRIETWEGSPADLGVNKNTYGILGIHCLE